MYKTILALILCCLSTISYAGMLGSCGTTRYSMQDLKELDKQEVIEEYCSVREEISYIESMQESAAQNHAISEMESLFKKRMLCNDNQVIIERFLQKKHKVKPAKITCKS